MRGTRLVLLGLAATVAMGCAATELKSRKDNAWSSVPQALPDTPKVRDGLVSIMNLPEPTWEKFDAVPSSFGHPLRLPAFVIHPVGVAVDWALIRPFYWLAGLAPEWFGLTVDDAVGYQSHMPELTTSRDAPRRFP